MTFLWIDYSWGGGEGSILGMVNYQSLGWRLTIFLMLGDRDHPGNEGPRDVGLPYLRRRVTMDGGRLTWTRLADLD